MVSEMLTFQTERRRQSGRQDAKGLGPERVVCQFQYLGLVKQVAAPTEYLLWQLRQDHSEFFHLNHSQVFLFVAPVRHFLQQKIHPPPIVHQVF